MALRIPVSGTSVKPVAGPLDATTGDGVRTGCGALTGSATGSRSTSRRTIRPPGPVPVTLSSSIPRSRASFRTNGVAKSRRPLVAAAGAATAAVTSSGSGMAGAAAPTSRAGSMSASVSPGASTTAMGSPTAIVDPGSAISRARIPSTSAAYSTRAFSVSISASGSPIAICVAHRDQPGLDDRLAGVGGHLRHPHHGGHQRCPIPTRIFSRPATTSSVLAIAARSSTLEMLGDASSPDTRSTGWSSQSKSLRCISSASQPP